MTALSPIELDDYSIIGATPVLSCWSASRQDFRYARIADNWQQVSLGKITIHNVYLSPYSSNARTEFLMKLAEAISGPTLIMGDFNMAPYPGDGLYGGLPSEWSKPAERKAFAGLLDAGQLADYTEALLLGRQEFTLERMIRGKCSRFRCDLALGNLHVAGEVVARYDHSVRSGTTSFTDHSAMEISYVDRPD